MNKDKSGGAFMPIPALPQSVGFKTALHKMSLAITLDGSFWKLLLLLSTIVTSIFDQKRNN